MPLYAALAVAVSLVAGADTTTANSPKKPATSHSSTSHSTSSHTKSSTAKTHSTSATHAGTKHTTAHTSGKKNSKTAKKRGQQAIDSDRARQIQEALIREHYLDGEPSGAWDNQTQAAMQHYQADQGWQNKTTPDSRALIKLGLGPSHDHLLNPESAMTSSASTSSAIPSPATSKPATASPAAPVNGDTQIAPKPAADQSSSPVLSTPPNR